jgi:hypothetical protein
MASQRPIQPIPLLLTAVAVVLMTSLIWAYFRTAEQKQSGLLIDSYVSRIKLLEQQIQVQTQSQQDLIGSLTQAQDARVEAETELSKTLALMQRRNEQLTAIQEEDWETHYNSAVSENMDLVARLDNLQLKHEIDIHNLAEDINILSKHRQFLENSFIKLEFELNDLQMNYHDLMQDTIALQLEHAVVLHDQEIELQRLSSLKTDMENELILLDLDMDATYEAYALEQSKLTQEYKEKIALLKSSLDKSNKTSAQLKHKQASTPVKSPAEKKKPDNTYRAARLESLGNAMKDRDSKNRKKILISVIPTIPEGISGNELAMLLPGMNNDDIISVIQSTKNHIKQPLDRKILNRITKTMDANTADVAVEILSRQ